MRVPLVKNIEQTIYHIRLAQAELSRLETDVQIFEKFAILIEDRDFFTHRGINWRGTTRAFWQYLRKGRRSGGSSITQQFCRSNFISRLSPTIRRKIVEMLLAKWIEKVWTKKEILSAYLASVRFDREVYGVHHAYKHFFLDTPKHIENWEAFVLIERLANIHGEFLGNRVFALLKQARATDILTVTEIEQVLKYYQGMVNHHFALKPNEPSPKALLGRLHELEGQA